MNILVISQYYYPEQFRVNDICEELAEEGNNVTVLAGVPNYPEGEIYPGYKNKKQEIHNGVKIIRCSNLPRKKGTIRLILNYISYVVMAIFMVVNLRKKYDLVFVYQLSPITMAIPALAYKTIYNVPVYLYCLDVWPESIKDFIPNEDSFIYKMVMWLSRKIYNKVDRIMVKCPSFIQYLTTTCQVNKENIEILPEHAEDIYLGINEHPINNKIIDFMFLGNVGVSTDCHIIVEAVRLLDKKLPYKVHFVGDGTALTSVKKLVHQYGLEDEFVFHGRHNVEKMPDFYKFADVCVLTLANDSAVGLTVPAKLTGYMAAARPVVAAISGDAKNIIHDAGCGYCVEAGDYRGLAICMKKCITENNNLYIMGMRGRKYFLNNFTKKIFMHKFNEIIIKFNNSVHNGIKNDK